MILSTLNKDWLWIGKKYLFYTVPWQAWLEAFNATQKWEAKNYMKDETRTAGARRGSVTCLTFRRSDWIQWWLKSKGVTGKRWCSKCRLTQGHNISSGPGQGAGVSCLTWLWSNRQQLCPVSPYFSLALSMVNRYKVNKWVHQQTIVLWKKDDWESKIKGEEIYWATLSIAVWASHYSITIH